MIRAADHTGFTVSDLDSAVPRWESLGFRVTRRARMDGEFAARVVGVPGAEYATAILEAAGYRVELLQYHAPAGRRELSPRPCDTGAAHLAFTVDNLDHVLAVAGPAGWQAADRPQRMAEGPRAGTLFVYLRDEDGVTVELIQPPG